MIDTVICDHCGKKILNFGDITSDGGSGRLYHRNCAIKEGVIS